MARSTKSVCRQVVRQILTLTLGLIIAAIILTDPLCATVLAAGRRLRRTRPERAGKTTMTASTSIGSRVFP